MADFCVFPGNCCVLLSVGGQSLLVDGPCSLRSAFNGVSEEEFSKMLSGKPPYENLCGMIFTHRHNDHFDRARVKLLERTRREVSAFSPSGATPPCGELTMGGFHIRYYKVAHSGLEFTETVHRVFLVEKDGNAYYFSGDGDWTSPVHGELLREFRPRMSVFNPNFITHPEGRALLPLSGRNFICHLPCGVEDVFGIARKCFSSAEKFRDELADTELIREYPTTVTL